MKPLLSSIIPFAGSGLEYTMGLFLKKILKRMLIIVGVLAAMFFFTRICKIASRTRKSPLHKNDDIESNSKITQAIKLFCER